MAYELSFDIKLAGLSDLQKIEAIIAAVGKQTSLTATQLAIFETALKGGVQSGVSLTKALSDVAGSGKSVGAEIAELAAQVQAATSAQQEHAQAAVTASTAQKSFADSTRQAKGAVDEAKASIFDLNKEMTGATKGFALGALGLGAVGGIGLQVGRQLAGSIIGTLKDAVVGTAEYARTIDNLAQRTGLSIAESQRFTQIAELAGVRVDSLTSIMRSLSRGLAEGTVEGKQQRLVLETMGITASDAAHNLRPISGILQEIGDKLAKMPAGPQRDFLANTLLGKSGLEILPAITRLNDLGATVDHVGSIMDTDGVRAAERYGDSLHTLGLMWEDLKHRMERRSLA